MASAAIVRDDDLERALEVSRRLHEQLWWEEEALFSEAILASQHTAEWEAKEAELSADREFAVAVRDSLPCASPPVLPSEPAWISPKTQRAHVGGAEAACKTRLAVSLDKGAVGVESVVIADIDLSSRQGALGFNQSEPEIQEPTTERADGVSGPAEFDLASEDGDGCQEFVWVDDKPSVDLDDGLAQWWAEDELDQAREE